MTLRKLVSLATVLMLTLSFVGAAKAATPGLTPAFGTPVPIAGGFAVEITNWDAKDPVGVGKVQFKVNGREIAWVRAVDESDPKLWSQAGSEYLLRRVELKPGKNRFEVWLNGVRVVRSTYMH